MTTIDNTTASATAAATGAPLTTTATTTDSARPASPSQQPIAQTTNLPDVQEVKPPTSPSETPAPPADLSPAEGEAIGPSTDTPAAKPDNTNGPVVVITLLLTTGARHPFKIDERYLKRRNVTVEAMDPYNISVYTLKELIWRDWRQNGSFQGPDTRYIVALIVFADWDPRPTTPSSIRLIHFGRMLDDKIPLKECRFQREAPNVVHMTVKPQDVDEEEARTGKAGSRREGVEEVQAGCRCVVL
ncbi:hypothetical protein M011DRAFT_406529 [Sporormia fimetaria CBS 119925]|uniref:UBL3-like ubiquitin domain-containing protein n=1 Tax=Sporormia fimetaria CBS 119925 TaxID=1340428 RepID=A0A6A6V6N2_9PLEO|nr:hypothetical protein M011DRAFT_406529 [Sporormia fimetaria CBS 119925]